MSAATSQSAPAVICVFCAASPGTSEVHLKAARELAQALHNSNAKLAYGGGTTGLMGEIGRTLVSLSGPNSVHGIIPKALVTYERATEPTDITKESSKNASLQEGVMSDYGRTTIVDSMHERKQAFLKDVLSGGPGSGFIAMSGGYGTIEELMEVVTWNQLGIHDRGIVVLNTDGYYDGMFQWVEKAVQSGFVKGKNANIMVEVKTPDEAIKALKEYQVSEERMGLDWTQS